MLKSVLFDMDGVIVDTEPLHYKSYYRMFDDVNIKVSDKRYASFTGKSTLSVCKSLCQEFHLNLGPETLADIKRDHFKHLFETDTSLALMDGVLDLIKDYHRNGLLLGLASSASMANINRVFDRFDLNRYFITKISGAELKASKPHPEIYTLAATAVHCLPNECMVIEDSTNGIQAAKAAEMFCVGFQSAHTHGQDYSLADMVVRNFSDISFEKLSELFAVDC